MKKLNIPIRSNVGKDDTLQISIYPSKFTTADYGQKMIFPYIQSKKSIDTVNRWYKEPTISISNSIDSAIKYRVGYKYYINSLSSIIHELVHYYQLSYIDESEYLQPTNQNFQQHLKQSIELEAYSTESYFYLSKFYINDLKKIMRMNVNDFEKRKALCNKANEIKFPNKKEFILK